MKFQFFILVTLLNLIASVTVAQTGRKDTGYANGKPAKIEKIVRSNKEWRQQLTPRQYKVARLGETEREFSGKYWKNNRKGTYLCACCDLELFSSQTKFKSGTGWPSFYAPIEKTHISQKIDRSDMSLGVRVEILCSRCDAHLGHVFTDGPRPTGLRFCMNSAALEFETVAETKKRREQEEKTREEQATGKEKSNESTSADSSNRSLRADRPVAPPYRPLVPHRLLPLLHAAEVHEELELTVKQVAALEKLFEETDGPWFRARIKPQAQQLEVLDQLEKRVRGWLDENSTPLQQKRLHQLELQAQGNRILLRDDVAKAIQLTPSQVKTFAENAANVAEAEAAFAKAVNQGKPLETLRQAVADAAEAESKALEDTLSQEQQQKLGSMLGQRFDTAKLTRIYPMAPELVPVKHWINSKPLMMKDLRGQVVLVHFYAFECHNCHANQDIYRRWQKELRDRGVVVIGIQTPETARERDPAAVRTDAESRRLDFPILVDLESENWKAWGNTVWPTVYVVDRNGYIRHWWQGELNWKGATGDKTIERVVETALQESTRADGPAGAANEEEKEKVDAGWETATFGNGCFWCTEAVFEELKGVRGVRSGYSGGRVPNPTYKQVGTGLTGHAEVIQMEFDPKVISYSKLLEVFWQTHDPTTLNQQGPDIGTQYRSVIFYHNDQQKELATKLKTKLNEAKAFGKPVVTEISEFDKFYLAESYHQDFYELNRNNRYCRTYIPKKLRLIRRVFRDEIKGSKDAPKEQ